MKLQSALEVDLAEIKHDIHLLEQQARSSITRRMYDVI